MKKFYIRTLTGTVYVSVVIGSILAGKYVFFAVFAVIMAFTLLEFYRMCRTNEIYAQPLNGVIISLSFYALLFLTGQSIIPVKFLPLSAFLIILVPFTELFRNKPNTLQNIAYTLTGIFLISVPFSILNLILYPVNESLYSPSLLIGMMVMIWASDSGAYMVGSIIGKNKMAERISPNKTWEGTIGGTLLGTIVAIIFFHFFNDFKIYQVIILSIPTIIAGILGDLTESLIKRNFGLKDSGKVLPGHGGLFDRFDSMLFAAPVYYALISIFLNN